MDQTLYTRTNREKRKRRGIRYNTHVKRERTEKEEGKNTMHTYK